MTISLRQHIVIGLKDFKNPVAITGSDGSTDEGNTGLLITTILSKKKMLASMGEDNADPLHLAVRRECATKEAVLMYLMGERSIGKVSPKNASRCENHLPHVHSQLEETG